MHGRIFRLVPSKIVGTGSFNILLSFHIIYIQLCHKTYYYIWRHTYDVIHIDIKCISLQCLPSDVKLIIVKLITVQCNVNVNVKLQFDFDLRDTEIQCVVVILCFVLSSVFILLIKHKGGYCANINYQPIHGQKDSVVTWAPFWSTRVDGRWPNC